MMYRFVSAVLAGVVAMTASSLSAAEDDVKSLASANSTFGVALFQRLNQDPGAANAGAKNMFLSPYSISTALAMVYAGARNNTLAQMENVLHFNRDKLQLGLPGLLTAINGKADEKRPFELSVANALWVDQTFPLQENYLRALKNGFQADGAYPADFVHEPEAMRQKINLWVEDQTHQKIKDLLPGGSVKPDTALVLANAIYFKGTWRTPFNKESTTDQDFQLGNGKTVAVPLMRSGNDASFDYAETPAFQAISLPYKTGAAAGGASDLSMVIILPKNVDGLPEVEKTITAENLEKWTAALKRQPVRVLLPRFTMTTSFELSGPLKALGMTDAFSPAADFAGISADSNNKLYISGVYHKAFVDVNEEGTEAAAATGVTMSRMAVMQTPTTFRADHPFFFMIRHQPTGSILFMGHVMNPKE